MNVTTAKIASVINNYLTANYVLLKPALAVKSIIIYLKENATTNALKVCYFKFKLL